MKTHYPNPFGRTPDFDQFLRVLWRKGRPAHLPFYEHLATEQFISNRLGRDIRQAKGQAYWQLYVEFWLGMGYDCIPLEIPFDFGPVPDRPSDCPDYHSEEGRRIYTSDDLERVAWPRESAPINFEPFEIVGRLIPDGVKIVAGVAGGPYEYASLQLLGVMGLGFLLADDPALVREVFDRLHRLYVSANRTLASMDAVGACRQGDDLGFKSATFLSPAILRQYVFPIYRDMAAEAHARGKPFVLHSCGNLEAVYEDLIACGIDAKHSFEDQILPVAAFQKRYGDRLTPLGGLDVDVICRSDERALRRYTRQVVETCFADHRPWALGTGNSLTDYMPVENYMIVLEEAVKVTGG